MNRLRTWLRRWLGIVDDDMQLFNELRDAEKRLLETIHIIQNEIRELRAEVTRLQIAQYVPPQQPEEKVKVIQTRTMKQYLDILEREQETSDAL